MKVFEQIDALPRLSEEERLVLESVRALARDKLGPRAQLCRKVALYSAETDGMRPGGGATAFPVPCSRENFRGKIRASRAGAILGLPISGKYSGKTPHCPQNDGFCL